MYVSCGLATLRRLLQLDVKLHEDRDGLKCLCLTGAPHTFTMNLLMQDSIYSLQFGLQKQNMRDFLGGPVTKIPVLPMQGDWVRSLVSEIDPTYRT